ncbi:MAG: DUF2892 domain-containing protein [Ignavibacteriae bacterium]|nr:DUF2892 domain-containing protein [Ignavibacteriota bacterium]
MKKNIGIIDKVIRLFVGLFIVIYIGFFQGSWWGLIGAIPLFTVLSSNCMLYQIFGISTCKIKEEKQG